MHSPASRVLVLRRCLYFNLPTAIAKRMQSGRRANKDFVLAFQDFQQIHQLLLGCSLLVGPFTFQNSEISEMRWSGMKWTGRQAITRPSPCTVVVVFVPCAKALVPFGIESDSTRPAPPDFVQEVSGSKGQGVFCPIKTSKTLELLEMSRDVYV